MIFSLKMIIILSLISLQRNFSHKIYLKLGMFQKVEMFFFSKDIQIGSVSGKGYSKESIRWLTGLDDLNTPFYHSIFNKYY